MFEVLDSKSYQTSTSHPSADQMTSFSPSTSTDDRSRPIKAPSGPSGLDSLSTLQTSPQDSLKRRRSDEYRQHDFPLQDRSHKSMRENLSDRLGGSGQHDSHHQRRPDGNSSGSYGDYRGGGGGGSNNSYGDNRGNGGIGGNGGGGSDGWRNGPPPFFRNGRADSSNGRSRSRCREYDLKGFCFRGDACVFEHGLDRTVLKERITSRPLLPSTSMMNSSNFPSASGYPALSSSNSHSHMIGTLSSSSSSSSSYPERFPLPPPRIGANSGYSNRYHREQSMGGKEFLESYPI